MPHWGRTQPLAYFLKHCFPCFPFIRGYLDFDQLVAFKRPVQLTNDAFGQPRRANPDNRLDVVGKRSEVAPMG